jgi:uncharacterized membrane protein
MTGLQPFDPTSLVLIAALNPATIAVAFVMGRKADQWQKIVVAAFAAAIAGFLLVFLVTFLKLLPAKGLGGEAGLVALQFGFGLLWAAIGYFTRRRT